VILSGLILLSLALGLAAWLGFVWSVKSGQYDDPEGPKYRMLDEEEGEERPATKPPDPIARPPEPPGAPEGRGRP
jgi:cbb3-type cytochrome oxidase maturation protein